jgi:hypothetical protein
VTKLAAPPAPLIRTLRRDVAEATTAQLMRIVATVDAMADRGIADDLIAPHRHRLQLLHPARPLLFARLLFQPLDPLIVPPPRWRPALPSIPRTAIAPMAEVVRDAMGAKAQMLMEAVKGHTADNIELIAALGSAVWPDAAQILPRSDIPPSWHQTGLDDAAYRTLARRIGAVLSQAAAMDQLHTDSARGLLLPDTSAVAKILDRVAGIAVDALPMIVALLLRRMPQVAPILQVMEKTGFAHGLKGATDQAAALLLDHLEREDGAQATIAGARLSETTASVARMVILLGALDHDAANTVRRQQIRTVQQHLDRCCQSRFASSLDADLLTPLREIPVAPTPAYIADLEGTARDLRGLESEARVIGGGPSYDRLLAEAAATVRSAPPKAGLDRADRLRMVEILAGPEAALEMMRTS